MKCCCIKVKKRLTLLNQVLDIVYEPFLQGKIFKALGQ